MHEHGTKTVLVDNVQYKMRRKPPDSWLISGCQLFPPIISPELFAKVQKLHPTFRTSRANYYVGK